MLYGTTRPEGRRNQQIMLINHVLATLQDLVWNIILFALSLYPTAPDFDQGGDTDVNDEDIDSPTQTDGEWEIIWNIVTCQNNKSVTFVVG